MLGAVEYHTFYLPFMHFDQQFAMQLKTSFTVCIHESFKYFILLKNQNKKRMFSMLVAYNCLQLNTHKVASRSEQAQFDKH